MGHGKSPETNTGIQWIGPLGLGNGQIKYTLENKQDKTVKTKSITTRNKKLG